MASTLRQSFSSSDILGTFLCSRGLGNILRSSQHIPTPVTQIQMPGSSRRREVIIPQRSYIPHHRQNYSGQFSPENPITFRSRSGREGITFTDILSENFDHLMGRDDPMFVNYMGPAVSLRLEVGSA